MSMPNIPDIEPKIKIKRFNVINLLLASIALEELALAHVANAEAEKMQEVLERNPSLSTMNEFQDKLDRSLKDIISKEILLMFKFEKVLDLDDDKAKKPKVHVNKATASGSADGVEYSDSDYAHFHRKAKKLVRGDDLEEKQEN